MTLSDLIGKWIVWTENMATGFLLTQDLLITFSSANMLSICVLDKI